MCGLYGYITKKTTKLTAEQQLTRLRITNALAVAMQSRGRDSTGIAGVLDGKPFMTKDTQSAFEFIGSKKYKDIMVQQPTFVIGHTRFATIGAVTPKNAHPFKIGRVVGAHNGHVDEYKTHYKDADVDSQAIFYVLDKQGNKFHDAFKDLSGHLSISWFDVIHPNKVYLVAHINPLAMVRIPELSTIFWASEKTALQSVIEATVGSKDRTFIELTQDTVYKISDSLTVKEEKTSFLEKAYDYYKGCEYTKDTCTIAFCSTHAIDSYSGYYFPNDDEQEADKLFKKHAQDDEIYLNDFITTQDDKVLFMSIVERMKCGTCKHDMVNEIEKDFYFDYDDFTLMCNECENESPVNPSIIHIRWDVYCSFVQEGTYAND